MNDIDRKILDSFQTYSSFKNLGATSDECIHAVDLFLNNGDISSYVSDVRTNVYNRQREMLKQAGEESRRIDRHNSIKKLASLVGSFDFKGTLKGELLGRKYVYKITPSEILEYEDGVCVAKISVPFGLVVETHHEQT